MITSVNDHWAFPDKIEEVKALCAEWGRAAKKDAGPGLIFRQVIQSKEDPLKITSITTWRSHEDSARWHASDNPEHKRVTGYKANVWYKSGHEIFDVLTEP